MCSCVLKVKCVLRALMDDKLCGIPCTLLCPLNPKYYKALITRTIFATHRWTTTNATGKDEHTCLAVELLFTHTHTRTHIHTHTHTHARTHAHIFCQNTHTHMHTHAHAHTKTNKQTQWLTSPVSTGTNVANRLNSLRSTVWDSLTSIRVICMGQQTKCKLSNCKVDSKSG
jgi:hypothetical protein